MPVNRERQRIRVYSGYDVDIKYSTLRHAREHIDWLIETHGAEAEIDTYTPRYSDTEYLGVYVQRLETDEEMAARIANEEIWEANWAERDRQEFERLKAKFGA